MKRETFGSIESVTLSDFGIVVTAKVDTGAWSGALHCKKIQLNGENLSYSLLGETRNLQTTSNFEFRQVRSANGQLSERYIVPITMIIKGKEYCTNIGLNDRSDMQHEMLLGRKFLIENNILVDVQLTLDDDTEAEKYL